MENIQDRSSPYSNGLVQSWDQLEVMWDYIFEEELRVDTTSSNVFLTETHLPPRAVRETMLETMFELFNVKGIYLHVQAPLAMYAAGKLTGCVVDSGHMSTSVFPVSQGFQIANACIKTAHGGHHLTQLLHSLLSARDILSGSNVYKSILNSQRGRSGLDVARYLKESYCSVDPVFEPSQLFQPEDDEEYQLPDGNTIFIGKELTRVGEAMFHPIMSQDLFDLEEERPLQNLVLDSIKNCSLELRKNLLSNVVLCGGNSHMPGLQQRLKAELKAVVPFSIAASVDVTVARGGDDAVWIGGSILAQLSGFQNHWITASEYTECGPSVVHELCPVHL
jgi:actin-related protein